MAKGAASKGGKTGGKNKPAAAKRSYEQNRARAVMTANKLARDGNKGIKLSRKGDDAIVTYTSADGKKRSKRIK